jgi:hypothetical protein
MGHKLKIYENFADKNFFKKIAIFSKKRLTRRFMGCIIALSEIEKRKPAFLKKITF